MPFGTQWSLVIQARQDPGLPASLRSLVPCVGSRGYHHGSGDPQVRKGGHGVIEGHWPDPSRFPSPCSHQTRPEVDWV